LREAEDAVEPKTKKKLKEENPIKQSSCHHENETNLAQRYGT
jgi:hypothetical protein